MSSNFSDYLRVNQPELFYIKQPVQLVAEANYASRFAESIYKQVQAFDQSLGDDYLVGVKLVSFGQTVKFTVSSISFINPSLIIFRGTLEDGSPIELVQHVTQISFLLTSLPRNNKEIPKKRIGFSAENIECACTE